MEVGEETSIIECDASWKIMVSRVMLEWMEWDKTGFIRGLLGFGLPLTFGAILTFGVLSASIAKSESCEDAFENASLKLELKCHENDHDIVGGVIMSVYS